MTALKIELDWYRCPQGYRFARASDVARACGDDPRTYADEDWIVPNGNERVYYRPFDKNDMICVAFAKLRTPESVREFISLYGSLIGSSPQWGDSVAACLRLSQRFYDLLSCKEKGRRRLATVFNSQVRESHIRGYKRDVGTSPPKDYNFGTLNQLIGTADIVPDPERGIQLRITTDSLIGGLWWQLANKLSGAINIRICRHCSAPFEAGPGTGRHVDANFCCDEHKVKYFSLARTNRRLKTAKG
jgi:hypothetical protein